MAARHSRYDFEAEIGLQKLIGAVDPVIRKVNGSGLVNATNAIFLRDVFRDRGEAERIWVNYLRGDPTNVDPRWWSGRPASTKDHELYDSHRQAINPFYTVSTFQDKGEMGVKRRIANFARTFVIGLDDIGLGATAKVGPDRIALPPSFVIETSPDNHQVGYILSEPIDKREIADVLQDALIHQGLGVERDPGQKNVTRYLRLPCGVNGKAKYVEQLGKPFEHALWLWEPERRYRYTDLVQAYGLKLERVRLRRDVLRESVMKYEDDPYVRKLDELELIMGPPVDKGAAGIWVPIRCPNVELHTDQDDTGSAYRVGGGYKCHHGTCEHVRFDDLQSYLALHFDVEDDELREMNAELARKRVQENENLDEYSKTMLAIMPRRRFHT